MITVLCANAGIDKVYEVANFAVGGFYHPSHLVTAPGGKGINVARVLAVLGAPHQVTGFAGGNNGRYLTRQLVDGGSPADFVPIAEESRVTVTVVDRVQHTHTRVDEVGALVTPGEVDKLIAKWRRLMGSTQMAVISGSAPRGVTKELYAELAQISRQAKVPLILDAHDELLERALPARPMMIKPNLAELSRLRKRQFSVPDGVVEAGRELISEGIGIVVVTMGARGAIAVTPAHGVWWARPPKVPVVNPVGSGDAFLAGFVAASLQRLGIDERMRLATAAGAANATAFAPGQFTREKVEELAAEVKIERLDRQENSAPPPKEEL